MGMGSRAAMGTCVGRVAARQRHRRLVSPSSAHGDLVRGLALRAHAVGLRWDPVVLRQAGPEPLDPRPRPDPPLLFEHALDPELAQAQRTDRLYGTERE